MPTGPTYELSTIQYESDLAHHEGSSSKHHLKMSSAGLSFFCAGMNDGSLGALVPYIIRTYNVDTDHVAIIYAATFFGWLTIAVLNTYLTRQLGLGVLLLLGAVLQMVAQALRTWKPPFVLYAITFFMNSLGMALQDTHSNNFVATIQNAHRWLGFIHAMYALGCGVGPLIATPIAAADELSRWYYYYVCLVGIGAVNILLVIVAFHDSMKHTPHIVRRSSISTTDTHLAPISATRELRNIVCQKAVWILGLYFFFFLGTVITASGWLVEFLVQVRGGRLAEMGYVSVGMASGTFLGRALLAEPTKRFGERRMILIYAVLCLGLELMFWLIPNIIINAVAISLFGFFSGPFFATGVHVGSKLFPAEQLPGSLAVVFLLGQVGGSMFPALTGLVASRVGVQALQPMLISLCSATAIMWLLVPTRSTHTE